MRIENWAYILFVHRRDRGGQFISYRRLAHWIRRITRRIELSTSLEDLLQVRGGIKQEAIQFEDRYYPAILSLWQQLLAKRQEEISNFEKASGAAVD